MKNSIAIIPARIGSKRIKQKNILNFFGKPLIAWTIQAAIQSQEFDNVFVSTDSKKIANIALKYGAKVPFIRNKILSNDTASTMDVINDACKRLIKMNFKFENVMCLYPTSPLLEPKTISKAFKRYNKLNFSYLVSVISFNANPYSSFLLSNDSQFIIDKNFDNASSKIRKIYFHDAGQFYLSNKKCWLNKDRIFSNKTYGFELKRYEGQDINTMEDLEFVKKLFQIKNNNETSKKLNFYLKTIDDIEKTRSKNNINWMDIMRLALKLDLDKTLKIINKINKSDKEISNLLSLLK